MANEVIKINRPFTQEEITGTSEDSPSGVVKLNRPFTKEELQGQPEKPGILGSLKKSFMGTGVGMYEGIVNPPYKVVAHALQGVESLARGGQAITYKNPLSGDIVTPYTNRTRITEPLGVAAQTAALALGPTVGGAMFGAGSAMEQGKSSGEVLKEAAIGGAFGKTFGLASGEALFTGKAGEFVRNKITPAIKSSAKKSYGKVLGATTKTEKAISEKVLPRVMEEKPFVWTRQGLQNAAERKQLTAGDVLDQAYENLSPKDKVSIHPILNRIDKAKNDLSIGGVLIEQNKSEAAVLDQLRQDLVRIAGRGKTSPNTLREYRQQLDGYIKARKKGFALSDADSAALNARRVMANSIREELAKKYPDIAKLNSEFSYQSKIVELLDSTIPKQKNPLKDVGVLVGNTAGHNAAGFLIKNLSSFVSDNVAWNSLAGGMKARIAEQLGKGNIEAASFTLMGAMNEWNKKIDSAASGFKSIYKSRKPLQVYGSQDEFLGGLWKDLAQNEKGSTFGKFATASAGATATGLGIQKLAQASESITLGQKNNNPINLKATEKWEGMSGKDKFNHAQFPSLDLGIRAALVNLRTHQSRNPEESLKQYMRTFKTKKGDYQAEYIAKELGIPPDTKLKELDMAQVLIPLARIESRIKLTEEQIKKVQMRYKLEILK